MPASAFAADTQSVAVQSVLAGKSAPYDLLIYFKSDASAALSLQQKADAAQAQARALLENAGDDVISWNRSISPTPFMRRSPRKIWSAGWQNWIVEQITWNGTVECVEPVEDTGEDENSIKMFANTIYQPDRQGH